MPASITTAAGLLLALNPNAPDETRGRIDALAAALADLVEEARVQTGMALWTFLERSTRLVRLRLYLQDRLRQLVPGDTPPPRDSVEAIVCASIRSIRRWADGRALRAEQWRLVSALRQQLASAQAELDLCAMAYTGQANYTTLRHLPAWQAGLSTRDDEFLRRVAPLLEARAALLARLARLDALGDDGRSHAVLEFLEGFGGVDSVRERLAPSMRSQAAIQHAAAQEGIEHAATELAGIDPESRRHAQKLGQLERLRSRASAYEGQIECERAAAADQLILAAITGRPDAVVALASALRPILPQAADQLEEIVTRGDELLATVAELLPADPFTAQPQGNQNSNGHR